MVWIKPEELFVGQTFWSNEYQNPYFVLQRRKGHGTKGLSSLFVATIDSVFDTRPAPFRILYHVENDDMEISIVIAVGVDRKEIQENWDWLEKTLLPTLESFENEEDVRRFVLTKIQGLVKVDETSVIQGDELDEISSSAVLQRFQTLFEMPPEEKLVNYYSCTYWRGRKPHQGKMYLSVNFMCFYSFLVGSQMKIKIRWTEITLADAIVERVFSLCKAQWTDARNFLRVDTVKALLQLRVNVDLDCVGIYNLLMKDGEL